MTDEHTLENRVNQALDDSVDSLSPELRRQLNQIRMKAIEKKSHKMPLWKMASAFSVLMTVTLAWQFNSQQSDVAITPFAEVLNEDLEMLDDLEFVYWLAEENQIASL